MARAWGLMASRQKARDSICKARSKRTRAPSCTTEKTASAAGKAPAVRA